MVRYLEAWLILRVSSPTGLHRQGNARWANIFFGTWGPALCRCLAISAGKRAASAAIAESQQFPAKFS
jgi:hypothetical protein